MKSTYSTPTLHRLGSIAELTGTGCLDLNGDGEGKTLGYPSDFVWRGIALPISDCVTGS